MKEPYLFEPGLTQINGTVDPTPGFERMLVVMDDVLCDMATLYGDVDMTTHNGISHLYIADSLDGAVNVKNMSPSFISELIAESAHYVSNRTKSGELVAYHVALGASMLAFEVTDLRYINQLSTPAGAALAIAESFGHLERDVNDQLAIKRFGLFKKLAFEVNDHFEGRE